MQPVDDSLVVVPQDHVGTVHEGHVSAELVENPGELAGDIATTHDDDPLRQLFQVKHLVRADRMFDALDRRHHRPSARCNQDLLGGDFLAARQLDRIGPGNVARSWKIVTLWFVSVSV